MSRGYWDCMMKSVDGIYRDGNVGPVDLTQRGIDESQATDLRRRLSRFAEDWDRPEMSVYDDPGSR